MIKAVFFDWFNTLARYEPSREELHSQALKEMGISVPLQKIRRGLLMADRGYFEENAISPIGERSAEEQARLHIRYEETVLAEAGVNAPGELFPQIMPRVRQLFKGVRFVLFSDAIPTLKTVKERNLTVGLLTNLNKDMKPICQGLGLESYLDFIVTAGEAGADKPKPPIFRLALQRGGVEATEAVHVGDQYQLDVVGARGVGITPILIDREDLYPEVGDCPRIHSLTELIQYL